MSSNVTTAGDQPVYNTKVVKQFAIMTVVWGIVGMLVGVIIAAELVWPDINFNLPWFHFGRLRPLHTNAVIFAFGGCALFTSVYHVVQRTCQTTLFGGPLAAFTFWGWQAIIVAAAITLPLGMTSSKEYAELEWPIDIAITVVWVAFAVVFFGTIMKRTTKHIYVANWFFGAFILTIAVLHLGNSAAIPVTATKSYSAYAGTIDAMVQWWYGHNAVGFFLTAGFLGIMYYFVPKQAERPVYSYRLSIVHGRMRPEDKELEMRRFAEGQAQILVATTVIEVGVNVPNASVMVIESAERFGLAQLHQLRGRVGRGAEQSYCILMTKDELSKDAALRMETMCRTNDGFEIAEVDLQLRGPGDLMGTQQSGVPDLKMADLMRDREVLTAARYIASRVLEEDPGLEQPQHAILNRELKRVAAGRPDWSRIS